MSSITPKSSASHSYILATTVCFFKWVATISLGEVKKENLIDFIQTDIIYQYGMPRYIIVNNKKLFVNKLMTNVCKDFKFGQLKSLMYNRPTDGLVVASSKMLYHLLSKVAANSKQDCHERLGEALWAYRTTYKMPTQSTLFALEYGIE